MNYTDRGSSCDGFVLLCEVNYLDLNIGRSRRHIKVASLLQEAGFHFSCVILALTF